MCQYTQCLSKTVLYVFAKDNGMYPWFTDNSIFSRFSLLPVQ